MKGIKLLLIYCVTVFTAAANPPPPPQGVDHAAFSRLLQKYVRAEDGLVDYGAWRNNTDDVAALDRYVAEFTQNNRPAAEGREAVAGWIHLHNALVIGEVLRHPQWQSVRQDRGFFTAPRRLPGGPSVSLKTLAEEGVVPRMGWRARAVLIVPARGGPPAPDQAPAAAELTAWVETSWRRWLARPGAWQWSPTRLRVPQMIFWHRHEWEAEGGWRNALAPWVPEETRPFLERKEIPVEFSGFDWTLNDPALPPQTYRGWRMFWDRLRPDQ